MAYRQTEKVRAHLEAQKQLIIASAIDIAAKGGLAAVTSRAIAERAGIAKGLVFKYFPDMAELFVRAEATVMMRDAECMRIAAERAADAGPVAAFVAALRALFSCMQSRESREMAGLLDYPRGISIEIERLLRPMEVGGDRKLIARATLGVVSQLAASLGSDPKKLSTAVLFVLKGIGASPADQRRAMELV